MRRLSCRARGIRGLSSAFIDLHHSEPGVTARRAMRDSNKPGRDVALNRARRNAKFCSHLFCA